MSQQPVTIQDIYDLFRTSAQEFDRRIAEQERLFTEAKAESDRRIEILGDKIAKLEDYIVDTYSPSSFIDNSDTWGDFVEKIANPDIANALLQQKRIEINYTARNVTSYRLDYAMKIDILMANNHETLAIMCFPEICCDDVDEFIEKLQKFKLAFPHYNNYQAYGAVAGIEINEGVDRYAYQKGLFVIRPSGDTVKIVNDEQFKAGTW